MNIDYQIFNKINSLTGKWIYLDDIMVSIAKWGFLLYGIVLMIIWFQKGTIEEIIKNRKTVLQACLSATIALGINQLIGLLYFRPRPFIAHHVKLLLDRSPDPSFPSDHATGAAAITISLFNQNKFWGIILTVMSLLLGFSRIYVGTHYPLDILGGFVTGIFGSYLTNKLWPFIDSIAIKFIELLNL